MSKLIPTNDPRRDRWMGPDGGTIDHRGAIEHDRPCRVIPWDDDWPDPSEVPQRGTKIEWGEKTRTVVSGVPTKDRYYPGCCWVVLCTNSEGYSSFVPITDFHVEPEPEPEVYSVEEIKKVLVWADDVLDRLRKNRDGLAPQEGEEWTD